jgi:hypothetical protein
LAKVNAKFETSFTIADPYASMSSEAMSGIDDRSALFTYKNSPWNVVARPSRDRATSETLLAALDGKTADAMNRALRVYFLMLRRSGLAGGVEPQE